MFDALPLEMVKVGEQTGALADMLNAVAEFYDEDLDIRIATVLSLVEPVLLVMMAIVVAGMLLAFYLPMFEAISTIQSKIHLWPNKPLLRGSTTPPAPSPPR